MSTGATSIDRVAVTGTFDGDEIESLILSDFQDDLPSNYRTPYSGGAGLFFTAARTPLHIAAEGFTDVADLRMLDAAPVVANDTDNKAPERPTLHNELG